MFVSLAIVVKVLVHGADKRHVNCLSSFVTFEASLYQSLLV